MIFLIEKTLKESSEFFISDKKSILIVEKNGITRTFFKERKRYASQECMLEFNYFHYGFKISGGMIFCLIFDV